MLQEQRKTLGAAVGVRRFVVGSAIACAIAIVQFMARFEPMNWLLEVPSWCIATIVLLGFLCWWLLSYASGLRIAAEPKVKIGGPSILTYPKSATGRTQRTIRIEVENESHSHLKNCSVREEAFINRLGQASGQRRHFRRAEEGHADMSAHIFRKTFDLRGKGDKEIIEIAYLDETQEGSNVLMLYATEPTARTLNSIPRQFFPHNLTISVTADNMAIAERRTFRLAVSDDGILEMIPQQSP